MSQRTLTIATVVGFVFSIAAFVYTQAKNTAPIDLMVYQGGAQWYLDGHPMYEQGVPAYDLALPFIYPPFAALLLTPFTLVDLATASWLLGIGSTLMVLGCVWLLCRALWADSRVALAVTSWAWGLAMLAEPLQSNTAFGQINILILALIVFDLLPRKRFIPQGWLIGVAAAIKITPAVMLLYFLVRKDVRGIAMAVVGFLGATLVGLVRSPSQTWEFWFTRVLEMNDSTKIGVDTTYISNQSLKGALQRFWPSQELVESQSSIVTVVWALLFLVFVGAVGYVMFRLIRQGLHIEAVLANAALMLLISPISWTHHWVWWPLWAIVAFYWAWQMRNTTLILWFACCALSILTVPPVWMLGNIRDDSIFERGFVVKLFVDSYTVWAIILLVLLWVFGPKMAAHRRRGVAA